MSLREAANATDRFCPGLRSPQPWWLDAARSLQYPLCSACSLSVQPFALLSVDKPTEIFLPSLPTFSAFPLAPGQCMATGPSLGPVTRARSSHSCLPQPSQLSYTQPYSVPDPPFLQSGLSPPPGRAHVLQTQTMATVGNGLLGPSKAGSSVSWGLSAGWGCSGCGHLCANEYVCVFYALSQPL